MANKDLFEQAIADAKKLKEISMANAKQAIEEAFAPRIQEMFRMKLSEMDEAIEEDLTEDELSEDELGELELSKNSTSNIVGGTKNPNPNAPTTAPTTEDAYVDEMTLEEILAELELEEDYQEEGVEPIEEAKKKEDDKDADDEKSDDKASGEIVDLSVDEFVDLIKTALADAMGGAKDEEEEPEAEETEPAEEEEGGEEESAEGDVIPLDEILAQLEEAGDMTDESLSDIFGKVVAGAEKAGAFTRSALGGFKLTPAEELECSKADDYYACAREKAMAKGKSASFATPRQGLAARIQSEDSLEETDGMTDESIMSSLKAGAEKAGAFGRAALSGFKLTPAEDAECMKRDDRGEETYNACVNRIAKAKGKKGVGYGTTGTAPVVGGMGQSGETSMDVRENLDEAIEVINTLKSQLNEVNLLNAKLLYVNKLFKAKNLTEAQKVKVITAFDRATTIRETKNIYAVLSESLTTNAAPKKAQLKESLGFASKPIGSAPARPIVEADAYVYRMQQLAGLRQPNI